MNRDSMLDQLDDSSLTWDLVVIGGGATGLGVALDAASRGYQTALLEQADFSSGTSSKSTKLIHGGVRYLAKGEIGLVREALHERERLLRNAPHLVKPLPFLIPGYKWWQPLFFTTGLKMYDLLAGTMGMRRSKLLRAVAVARRIPNLRTTGLRGGTLYVDAQFDDARLAISLARTAAEFGAAVANYVRVTGLTKENGRVTGVEAEDTIGRRNFRLKARCVVNATGPYTDGVRKMDNPDAQSIVQPSQGIHLVLDRSFLGGDSALLVPHTDDSRVLFAIPWHNRVLLGTTDTPDVPIDLNPKPLDSEIDYLLEHAARYLRKAPARSDIRATFAGLRPLVRPPTDEGSTASISREHSLFVSKSGLITIAGGKWTTYRKMAQDTVDRAIEIGDLRPEKCHTAEMMLHASDEADFLAKDDETLAAPLHPDLPYRKADIVAAVRYEMAQNLDDVLERRTRCRVLDEKASREIEAEVEKLMTVGRSHGPSTS